MCAGGCRCLQEAIGVCRKLPVCSGGCEVCRMLRVYTGGYGVYRRLWSVQEAAGVDRRLWLWGVQEAVEYAGCCRCVQEAVVICVWFFFLLFSTYKTFPVHTLLPDHLESFEHPL